MKLENLQINHFRNLVPLKIDPSPTLNLIYGQNGSGKSSLLEAIHFLGYGRSFRTTKPKNAIQNEQTEFQVFAKCSDHQGIIKKVGLSRNLSDEFQCSVDGERSNRVSDIVSMIPVQIFTPQSIEQLMGSPSARRRFLDWGLFHVEQSFQPTAKSYSKVLRQRNALLKQQNINSNSSDQFDYWTTQLALLGEKLDQLRVTYLEGLNSQFKSISDEFLPEFCLEITYYSGWDKSMDLASHLNKRSEQDQRFGHTGSGPHKGDIRIKANGQLATEVLSRGQLRMLVAALHLAQTLYLSAKTGHNGVFLLDDIGAELDEGHRNIFIQRLLKTQTQLFITAISKHQFTSTTEINNKKLFHVEHGRVTEE